MTAFPRASATSAVSTLSALAPFVGFFSITLLVAPSAFALPLPNATERAAAKTVPTLEEITESGVDFTAIVALDNCSGSLVRFVNSKPTDKALVLTNGHCYEGGFLKPGEAIADKSSSRSFRLLNASGGKLASLRAEKVVYATMTGTDMTLYRLNTTFAAIKSANGVDALTLSDAHPEDGTQIRVVSGYWRKIYACGISKFVHELREGDWTFTDSIKYSQPGCNTIGGTSGSPIINADTHEVVGINNTGNESGKRCTENNPCEVDPSGTVTVEKGASYGQETYQIYACLNESNALDLNKQGCTLTKPGASHRLNLVSTEEN